MPNKVTGYECSVCHKFYAGEQLAKICEELHRLQDVTRQLQAAVDHVIAYRDSATAKALYIGIIRTLQESNCA